MESSRNTFTIDVRRLRVLRELQQRGTVGATAKALNLTPSAISQQIASLGREVGAPLLRPLGRGVRLTPQAHLLLDHAAAMDAQLERARADLAAFEQGTVGHVAIGAFATAVCGVVAPALRRLRAERPRLRLEIREAHPPSSFTRLDLGELDLVVSVDYRDGPPRFDGRYARTELLDDPLLVAVPVGHPLAGRKSIELLALAGEDWISGGGPGPCTDITLSACAAAGFTPSVAHEVDDYAAFLKLVEVGCGVGLVPMLAVAGGVPPGVVLRPAAGPQHPCRHIYAAIRAGAERSPILVPVLEALVAAGAEASAGAARTSRPERHRVRPVR